MGCGWWLRARSYPGFSAELTHEFVHKTGGGVAVSLPALRQWSVGRRTKSESGSPQAWKLKILPVGNMKHTFGVDEYGLLSGKSCSWCGSLLESTNGYCGARRVCAPGFAGVSNGAVRGPDRLFAAQLYERGVGLEAVENALILAAARRRRWASFGHWRISRR